MQGCICDDDLRRELDQFLHAAAHDLAEPARTVQGFLQLLERRLGPDLDTESREYLGFAHDAAERLQTMLAGLLELARIGRAELPSTPVPLGDAAAAAAARHEPRFHDAGGGIEIGVLPTTCGDIRLWQRVFDLLLDNALRYRSERPPLVHVEAGLTAGGISVSDNGIGIPVEFQERIFEPFQRLHSRDAIPGVGLGLTIARRIVERHGGRIAAGPSTEGGSRFTIVLPACR